MTVSAEFLFRIYRIYHTKEWAERRKDPVVFLSSFTDTGARECAAFVLSYLAYGNTATLTQSLSSIWAYLLPVFLGEKKSSSLQHLKHWKYRFTDIHNLTLLIDRIHRVQQKYGSLEECFRKKWESENHFKNAIVYLRNVLGEDIPYLADPQKDSACKRWMLFLRWMRRKDEIDPGGWNIPPLSSLIVPLDTHLFSLGKEWGWIRTSSPTWKAAESFTTALRQYSPEDPLRFEFSLYCWYAEKVASGGGISRKSPEGNF